MINKALQVLALAGICGAGVVTGAAFAQAGGVGEDEPASGASASADEEVIVRGRLQRSGLRARIELAENAFYDRFNAINSDDEFDIVCRQVVELGSRIPKRVCEPNFVRAASERIGKDTLMSMQGGAYAGNTQAAAGEAHYKRLLIEQEIRKLAKEDAVLLQRLMRLAALQESYATYNDE